MQALLLDLTRSMRRAGRVATGVDRVEHAYLAEFIRSDRPVFGFVRTTLGYALLDRDGMKQFFARVHGRVAWGAPDLLSRMGNRGNDPVQRPESDLRKLAIARTLPQGLRRFLRKNLPDGYAYFNVGHSNLTDRVLFCVDVSGGQAHVMIHDVIPLEYPEYQRKGTVAPFRAKLKRVRRYAHRVLYNSADTQRRAEGYMRAWGDCPKGIVAHLGTVVPVPRPQDLPVGLPPDEPYFVVVGTIEPRKNHAFLLDLWEGFGPDAPPLLICGSRGWNNDAVFARLDALPPGGPIREVANLSDGALAAVVKNSAGMLFPSFAEGFGLPPAEAVTLGTRVLCNDLPVLKEFLGNIPVYASVTDRYLWINNIKEWARNPEDKPANKTYDPPNWNDHFKITLRLSG